MMFRAIIISAILLYQSAVAQTIYVPTAPSDTQATPQVNPQEVVAVEEQAAETQNETEGDDTEMLFYGRELFYEPHWYGDFRFVTIEGEDRVIRVNIYDRVDEKLNKADGEFFFADLIGICKTICSLEGIPLEALLAQAYTEGGAGKQGVYRMSNNLFGIRAGRIWDGYVYSRDLGKTFINFDAACKAGGRDLFRAYEDMEESVNDYIMLIRNSYLYRGALGKSAKRYLKHLVEHGYGSEDMVDVWMNVIKTYKLKKAIE